MVVRLVERKQANGLKHLFKRLFKYQTLPQDATSNGGDASRVGKIKRKDTQPPLNNPCTITDARRVAPIRAQCPGITVLYMASNLLFSL